MFAEVAISISTFQSFTYKIPSNLTHIARVGSRAKVQLGNRLVYGVITSINKNTTYEGDIKPVSDIIEDGPVLTKELWELIYWISYYYVTPIGKVFNTVLPISISKNYSPQLNWYAKYNELKNGVVIGNLKKKAPKQYNVYRHIKKASPTLLKV